MKGTVSAGFAGHLMRFAISQGADPKALAERSAISPEALRDPDGRIPLRSYVALMGAAKALCAAPDLALRLGAERDSREISLVGLICYAAPTMGEALKELNRYGRLALEVDIPAGKTRFQITPHGDALWMVDTRTNPNAFPELTESTWSRFIGETARHFPGAPFAKAVHVTHARPAHGADYEALWKVPVTFEADWNAIQIDPSWLNLPLHNPSSYAFGVLSQRADRLLAELEASRTARGRVEAALLPVLHKGEPGMVKVAVQLGVSRQTLYRQLHQENVTYKAVVDALRHTLALHYLNGGKVSVNETAYLVGFSDPSAFSRAFKRWTGSSPKAARAG
ncbi:MAG: AraC family transcriptional regulator [Caulobacter sp.]|nr:AraC family transcriptional regulator [Caulobacter sp.]